MQQSQLLAAATCLLSTSHQLPHMHAILGHLFGVQLHDVAAPRLPAHAPSLSLSLAYTGTPYLGLEVIWYACSSGTSRAYLGGGGSVLVGGGSTRRRSKQSAPRYRSICCLLNL